MRDLHPRELLGLMRKALAGSRFLKATPFLSREDMRRWQWQRISALVHHAYENVPFYREHYGKAGFAANSLLSSISGHLVRR